jgi:hypothetical protein
MYFTPLVSFTKVSALRSASGKDELRAQQSYVCVRCGTGLEEAIKAAEEPSPGLVLGHV